MGAGGDRNTAAPGLELGPTAIEKAGVGTVMK